MNKRPLQLGTKGASTVKKVPIPMGQKRFHSGWARVSQSWVRQILTAVFTRQGYIQTVLGRRRKTHYGYLITFCGFPPPGQKCINNRIPAIFFEGKKRKVGYRSISRRGKKKETDDSEAERNILGKNSIPMTFREKTPSVIGGVEHNLSLLLPPPSKVQNLTSIILDWWRKKKNLSFVLKSSILTKHSLDGWGVGVSGIVSFLGIYEGIFCFTRIGE
ncbi:hypothetical protein NPIL_200721 [Nephila pilipes]|uniref:Uncharacterized protein n=1 Tax=Nephila pilipes TaxID=299642 RepID=A0A8X6NH64_NEPPI|nr:hypothetical protein NPIL_200721 [Nephila pilipes]